MRDALFVCQADAGGLGYIPVPMSLCASPAQPSGCVLALTQPCAPVPPPMVGSGHLH